MRVCYQVIKGYNTNKTKQNKKAAVRPSPGRDHVPEAGEQVGEEEDREEHHQEAHCPDQPSASANQPSACYCHGHPRRKQPLLAARRGAPRAGTERAIETRFTVGNAEGAEMPRAGPDGTG
jgi:hypothetical protein